MRILSTLAIAILLVSCSGKKEDENEAVKADPVAPQEPTPTFTLNPNEMENPTNIVVSVDGDILSAGDLNTETRIRLSNMRGTRMGPDTLAQMRQIVIEQFITRSLLLSEAKKRELVASEDDLKAELTEIQKMVPEGVTVDDIINNSPLGKEAMLGHIKNKIVIDKLSKQLMKDGAKVSKDEVEEFIEKHKADLLLPETVEARHILLKFDDSDDDKTKKEKKDSLETIRKSIIDGADFAETAKKESQGPSAKDGGMLPRFGRNRMVPEFDQAAFSQKIGKVGKVITTEYGHHIILVEKHEKEGMVSREQIEARIKDLKMQSVMMEFINELRSKADIKTFSS
jgi:peptidyl-prolyl cis-trans isomerase C